MYLLAYLRNMAMPMCVMLRLMVFHDLVMTNTSRSLSGTLMESLSSVRLRRHLDGVLELGQTQTSP